MPAAFIFRVLLLHPVVVAGGFVVAAPLVAWRMHHFLVYRSLIRETFTRSERAVAVVITVALFAGLLSLTAARWGAPLGDSFRLRALQRSAMASAAPAGAVLVAEREDVSSYLGFAEYTAGKRDRPDTSFYVRSYRVDDSLPKVFAEFERLAKDDGWRLVGSDCGVNRNPGDADRSSVFRRYERRLSGFQAALVLSADTTPSTVFPGTAVSNAEVALHAPSVLSGDPPLEAAELDRRCLGLPTATPAAPPPRGSLRSGA